MNKKSVVDSLVISKEGVDIRFLQTKKKLEDLDEREWVCLLKFLWLVAKNWNHKDSSVNGLNYK
jgi:hypothetical protein